MIEPGSTLGADAVISLAEGLRPVPAVCAMGPAAGRMDMDHNTASRHWRAAATLVANLVADWAEREASRARIALLESRGCERPDCEDPALATDD